MFERFTERARQVVVLAQEEARKRNHPVIMVEHLIAGLYREEEGLAAQVLNSLSFVTHWDQVLDNLTNLSLDKKIDGQIPFTADSKKCLELALREALSLGHNYIGTEHILLGIVRQGWYGQSGEEVRRKTIKILSGPGTFRTPPKIKEANTTYISLSNRILDLANALQDIATELQNLKPPESDE